MVKSLAGLETKNGFSDEGQQHYTKPAYVTASNNAPD
jgi:hypothetical protein